MQVDNEAENRFSPKTPLKYKIWLKIRTHKVGLDQQEQKNVELDAKQETGERTKLKPTGAAESGFIVQIVDLLLDHQINRSTKSSILKLAPGSVDLTMG